jgi:hypothetical protein
MATLTQSQPQATSSGGLLTGIPRQVLVLAGFLAVVIGNSIAEAVPINQQTSAEISNRVPLLITPANYAFAIWGLIWIGLGAFAVWQALPAQRDNALMNKIAPAFLLTCFLNVFWLVLFHFNQFVLAAIVISLFTLTLIYIYLQLGIGRRAVSLVERLTTHVPFSLYLGWLTVATVVNIAYTLYDAGYRPDKQTQELWTVVLLVIVTIIGSLFAFRHKEIALIGVFVWALVAISNARGTGITEIQQQALSQTVQTAALACAGILVAITAFAQIATSRVSLQRPVVSGRRSIS